MKGRLTRKCLNKFICKMSMSVHSEFNSLVGLINELYFRTKYDLKITREEMHSLDKRIKKHLDNMACIMTDFKYNQSIQKVPLTEDEMSAEGEFDFALMKIKKMLCMASNDLVETWYLNFLISEVVTHVQNFIMINLQNRCDDNSFDTPIIDWREAMRTEYIPM